MRAARGGVVDFQNPVQPGEVDGDYLVGSGGWFYAGDDGAAAAVGYGDDVGVGTPVQ